MFEAERRWRVVELVYATMNVTIELSDDQAAAFSAKASAQGLSLEAWVQNLAKGGAAVLDWSQCTAVESVPGKVGGA